VPFAPKHGNPSKASETIISALAAVETATQKTINGRKDESKCCRTQDVFSAIGFTSTSEQSNLSPLTQYRQRTLRARTASRRRQQF
jgi:hypothetical protein